MQQRLPKKYEQYPHLTNYSSHAKTSFTDVLPLLMQSRGYALRCDFQCIHGFICPKVDCYAFIWHQPVACTTVLLYYCCTSVVCPCALVSMYYCAAVLLLYYGSVPLRTR